MTEASNAPRRGRRLRRTFKFLAGLLVLAGVAVIFCRAAVGWIFPISSGSMEPTICTGESVFLRYGNSDLQRFDIVAFRDEGSGAAIKRCVALNGESVMVSAAGDLRIDGRYIPEAPGRPAPILIFDSTRQSIDEHWRHGGSAFDPWAKRAATSEEDAGNTATQAPESEVWELDGRLVQPGADLGLLRFGDRVTDGHLNDDDVYELGQHGVHDVVVEFEALIVEPGGRLRVEMSEQSDVFAVSVPIYAGEDEGSILLHRIRPRVPMEAGQRPVFLMGTAKVVVPVGEWVRIRMANIDNRITFSIGDVELQVDYEANTPLTDPMSAAEKPISVGERVKLGANGLPMRVRNLRVLRDFHVVSKGRFGSGQEVSLGADDIFVIGDSSAMSQDSRERGPIEISRVIGTAKAVVRPLSCFRWL